MKNNDSVKKFFKILLAITIIGIFILMIIEYLNYKKNLNKKENEISKSTRLGFNIENLWKALGGKDNIISIQATHNKVKIEVKNMEIVDFKKMEGNSKISGILKSGNKISIITGNISKEIERIFNIN